MHKERNQLWRTRLHEIIYESNTLAGKAFDVSLLILIVASILIVMLDSIGTWHGLYGDLFLTLEWVFTFFLLSNMRCV